MNNYFSLLEALQYNDHVKGLTHDFYRYPARFSPFFANVIIRQFSEPGETVFDPFVGGGTSIVEALSLGRNCVGFDISSLAIFISKVKITILSDDEVKTIKNWINNFRSIKLKKISDNDSFWIKDGYLKNLDHQDTWRIRNYIDSLLHNIDYINNINVENFIRCSILKTGQWALDGRKEIPNLEGFRKKLSKNINNMLENSGAFHKKVLENKLNSKMCNLYLKNRSAIGVENENVLINNPPKLIIMSPPYPGVHILYHRWQVKGRKETPAPFWIANQLDGARESYYTMGNRQTHEKNQYFDEMHKVFISLAKICTKKTNLVQLIAFSNPDTQLKRYLEIMESAGFSEVQFNTNGIYKRLWRIVPNRKWYADLKGKTSGSKELLLIHRLS